MSGLGGLNKSPHGVVLGLVQLQLPVVQTPADLAHQTAKICAMVAKARRNMPSMDLVVFPEYALHGLSMDTNPQLMCRLDGPEVTAFQRACQEHHIWGCFSLMEYNPHGNPYNSGIIIDDQGACSSTTVNSIPGCRWNPGSQATWASRCAMAPGARRSP